MITPVSASLLLFFQVAMLPDSSLLNQRTSFPFYAFNILDRVSFSAAAFPGFKPRMAAATFVTLKIFSFSKSIKSRVSVGMLFWGSTNP